MDRLPDVMVDDHKLAGRCFQDADGDLRDQARQRPRPPARPAVQLHRLDTVANSSASEWMQLAVERDHSPMTHSALVGSSTIASSASPSTSRSSAGDRGSRTVPFYHSECLSNRQPGPEPWRCVCPRAPPPACGPDCISPRALRPGSRFHQGPVARRAPGCVRSRSHRASALFGSAIRRSESTSTGCTSGRGPPRAARGVPGRGPCRSRRWRAARLLQATGAPLHSTAVSSMRGSGSAGWPTWLRLPG